MPAEEYRCPKPETAEGQLVAQMEDFIQVLQRAYAETLVEAGENYRASEGNKKTTQEGGSVLQQARSNKKIPSNKQSANVRRSVKQRGAGSAHVNMSSTAAANLLGIDSISNASDKVKYAVSVLGGSYDPVTERHI